MKYSWIGTNIHNARGFEPAIPTAISLGVPKPLEDAFVLAILDDTFHLLIQNSILIIIYIFWNDSFIIFIFK